MPDNNTPLPVKGQIVISLLSRDGHGTGSVNAVVDNQGNLSTTCPSSDESTDITLPPGWEQRRAANGRAYYVNHHTRTTQWNKPETTANFFSQLSQQQQPSNQNQSSTQSPPPLPERNPVRCGTSQGPSRPQRATSRRSMPAGTSTPPLPTGYESKISPQGQLYFFHVPSGVSTWHDPRVPKDLLTILGANPSDTASVDELLGPSPSGWEVRQTPSGKSYYVDHNLRTTQFTDPRLTGANLQRLLEKYADAKRQRHEARRRSNNDAPPPTATTNGAAAATAAASVAAAATTTNGNVSNVRATTADNTVVMPPNPAPQQQAQPEERVPISSANNSRNDVTKNGKSDVDALPKYKRDLVAKIKVLRQDLSGLQPPSGHCRLEVSRTDVFEDSYRLIVKMRPKDLRKRLMIKFKGEDGLDYGGIAREWLYLLSHEMLNPYYGLFQYSR